MDGADRAEPRRGMSNQEGCEWRANPSRPSDRRPSERKVVFCLYGRMQSLFLPESSIEKQIYREYTIPMLALEELASVRSLRIATVDSSHKINFAQYLTPLEIARYMAQLTVKYWENTENAATLLDPGAGSGILSCCLIDELSRKYQNMALVLDTYEIDQSILPDLELSYHTVGKNLNRKFRYTVYQDDFISDVSRDIYWNIAPKYNLIIMNPPYKKINSNSMYRKALHDIGIKTVNTYSAFMAIAIKLLKDKGVLTAIVPRSFCNGPYFLSFRKFLFEHTAILHIHSFDTRDNAFGDENVLQENIIITLQKTHEKPKNVAISFSEDKFFTNYTEKKIPYREIIDPSDVQLFISIPKKDTTVSGSVFSCSNAELSFEISTGPIVDFRVKEKLVYGEPIEGIPLLYAAHIRNQEISWPVQSKKPNAIVLDAAELEKNAFSLGYYILVKRFSAKEEKRRIYATLLSPKSLPGKYFTLENHLNIIHCRHSGINKDIAFGLAAYLNTVCCDNQFRNFSGHTQVNATDLRNMKYPSSDILIKFGKLTKGKKIEEYDQILQNLVIENAG
jgi:adenine-specific DNA-methyltransferase